jgi:L-amino acid N-acyltransferase YncA
LPGGSRGLGDVYKRQHQGHLGKVGFKFGRWLGTVLMQKSL